MFETLNKWLFVLTGFDAKATFSIGEEYTPKKPVYTDPIEQVLARFANKDGITNLGKQDGNRYYMFETTDGLLMKVLVNDIAPLYEPTYLVRVLDAVMDAVTEEIRCARYAILDGKKYEQYIEHFVVVR